VFRHDLFVATIFVVFVLLFIALRLGDVSCVVPRVWLTTPVPSRCARLSHTGQWVRCPVPGPTERQPKTAGRQPIAEARASLSIQTAQPKLCNRRGQSCQAPGILAALEACIRTSWQASMHPGSVGAEAHLISKQERHGQEAAQNVSPSQRKLGVALGWLLRSLGPVQQRSHQRGAVPQAIPRRPA
jgi:hypothetical protein